MAEEFTWSPEFHDAYHFTTQGHYGEGGNIASLVSGFYFNVLQRTPDQAGLDFYTNEIASQQRTVGRVLAEISDSPENRDLVMDQIEDGIDYLQWFGSASPGLEKRSELSGDRVVLLPFFLGILLFAYCWIILAETPALYIAKYDRSPE